MISFIMAMARAASVPGRIWSQRVAREERAVSRGSTTMRFLAYWSELMNQTAISESALEISSCLAQEICVLGYSPPQPW